MNLFFYSTMHASFDVPPSGDVMLANNFIKAFKQCGYKIHMPCAFKSYQDIPPNADICEALEAEAQKVIQHIIDYHIKPDAFITYHVYHKSPDLIGPKVAEHFDIPYLILEPSHALKQAYGPFSFGYTHAIEAFHKASKLITLSSNDTHGLEMVPNLDQSKIVQLEPFIDESLWPQFEEKQDKDLEAPLNFLTVAMMREGDKANSYRFLKEVLSALHDYPWRLTIVGDGPLREEMDHLFIELGDKVHFAGQKNAQEIAAYYHEADLLLWPGRNEAIGLVYLEAALYGTPSMALKSISAQDIIVHEETGFLAQGLQQYIMFLTHILEQPQCLEGLGVSAKKRFMETFSFKANAQKLKTILESVVS